MTVPKLRAPLVLVHGLFGFNRLRLCGWTIASYFPGIPETLAAGGNRVLVASVSPTGGVADRAAQLKAFLDRSLPGEAVHLIGHSMGGLDCRYLISRLGMSDRVLTLTTIGTPHRGSPFADWGVRHVERLVKPFLELFEIPSQAFRDLTTDRCRQFNLEVPDMAAVRYYSVASRFERGWLTPEWQLSHRIIQAAEGPNDGLVSVASARNGARCTVWEGDHASQVNWPNPIARARGLWRDRGPDYAALVQNLADDGF